MKYFGLLAVLASLIPSVAFSYDRVTQITQDVNVAGKSRAEKNKSCRYIEMYVQQQAQRVEGAVGVPQGTVSVSAWLEERPFCGGFGAGCVYFTVCQVQATIESLSARFEFVEAKKRKGKTRTEECQKDLEAIPSLILGEFLNRGVFSRSCRAVGWVLVKD